MRAQDSHSVLLVVAQKCESLSSDMTSRANDEAQDSLWFKTRHLLGDVCLIDALCC